MGPMLLPMFVISKAAQLRKKPVLVVTTHVLKLLCRVS
jgi:hypothetical protein